jgi:hypothetical protein
MFEVLLLIISIPAFCLACALWAVVGYQSARRMGYRAPGASMILLIGACAGVASTVIRNPPNSTGYRFFVDFFWLTWLFAVATRRSWCWRCHGGKSARLGRGIRGFRWRDAASCS